MLKKLFSVFIIGAAIVNASTVVWTASGTVSDATGVYAADGISADTPMSVRMTYSDQAGKVDKNDFRPFNIPSVTFDYQTNINLAISLTIGAQVWSGTVASGPNTFLVHLNDTGEGVEDVKANITEANGAVFDSFPLEIPENDTLIQLEFTATDNSFVSDQITATGFNASAILLASGSFQSGLSNRVTFTLDPDSVLIENGVPPAPTPILSLLRTNDNLEISWESVLDVNYVLQSSTTLEEDSWITASPTLFGNGGTLSRNVAIAAGFNLYYRVLAVPAPPL